MSKLDVYTQLFLYGIAVGAIVAVPVGPIGIMCLQRTLAHGGLVGFISGLGAATADVIFSMIALISLSTFWTTLKAYQTVLEFVGGIAICLLGIFVGISHSHTRPDTVKNSRLIQMYISAIVITLSNPATIIVIATLMTVFALGEKSVTLLSHISLLLGIFLGSASWWVLIGVLSNRGNIRSQPQLISWINKAAGASIFLFGVFTLLTALYEYLYTL